ncbi:Benzyl alcohol O-benzoyltransferase [Melia azedarach]|uniref:Benzyl alcohol O-benzoyltransferase n=1 Tax=Melia azedarach TaxID=155640 RepID=A0ACC1Y8B9_MELAZ|nr:Benzyl alcohol O-benzoyltransferase [Melia azedarach]
MEPKSCQLFSVTRQEPELIIPARPTPQEVKQLSDIDNKKSIRIYSPFICFYRNKPSPPMKGKDPVKLIREALSKALVFYYPLAGRLQEGPNRKLMVDCNGKGVLFVEADANIKLDQLGDSIHPPFPYLKEIMYGIPHVTRLTCGGFIFALLFHHSLCDGPGLKQFLEMLTEFAKGADSPSLMPVWRREILNARNPPQITCPLYEQEKRNESTKPFELKSFFFGPEEISAIRNHVPLHLKNSTKFELITACVWRCRTTALKLKPDQIVRLSCVVNIRGKDYNILPPGYYGNAFASPVVCAKVDDLCKNPLGYAVELVKKVKATMNEEYLKSVIDSIGVMGLPVPPIMENLLVSSTTGQGFEEIDFGWRRPVYAGVAASVPLISLQFKYQTKDRKDGILVLLGLPEPTMKKFEEELKQITHGSVEDLYKIKGTELLSKL